MAVAFPDWGEDAGGTVAHGLFPTALLCFTNAGKGRSKTLGGGGAETFAAAADEWRHRRSTRYRFTGSLPARIAAVARVSFKPKRLVILPLLGLIR